MDTINIGAYGFLESIADITIAVKNVCLKMSIILLVITATYGVIRFLIGWEEGHNINFKKYVWTPLITIFLLANYSFMIDITNSIGGVLINTVPKSSAGEITKELTSLADRRQLINEALYNNKLADIKASDKSFWGRTWDKTVEVFRANLDTLGNSVLLVTNFIQTTFILVCRLIIENVRALVLGFLTIVGPVAILLSITPIHRDMFKKWYISYVAVLFWALSLNVLDALVVSYSINNTAIDLEALKSNDKESEAYQQAYDAAQIILSSGGTQEMFLNIALGLMYLTIPLLTGFFAGDKLAGGLLSNIMTKTAQIGMQVISAGAGAIGKIPKGGGGGGGGGDTAGLE